MAFPPYTPDTTVGLATYQLTSIAEIERLFSRYGVDLHTDDLNPSDEDRFNPSNSAEVNKINFLDELVQRASSEVMSNLMPRYTVDAVYKIPRIREIATYIAAYKLTRRRGNEPLFDEEYVDGMEDLVAFKNGSKYLDAPSNGPRAYIQSGVVDNRYSAHPWRVLSSGMGSTATVPNQQIHHRYAFYWL